MSTLSSKKTLWSEAQKRFCIPRLKTGGFRTENFDNTTNSQEPSQANIEALAAVKLPLQLINTVGHICFALILVAVVQTFFEIRWIQAFCNVCIFYAIYWILNKALWSVFSYVLLFVFQQFFASSWRWHPTDPLSP